MRNAIVLAAGKGTRMKSDRSKVMHTIIDRSMLAYIIDALRAVSVQRIVVIVGYQAESIKEAFPNVEFALQQPQLGTGHAVMQATQLKDEDGDTVIINGDGPCIQPETLEKLFQTNQDASLTLLTSVLDDGAHYGRIVRDESNHVQAIVEAKDCTEEQKKLITVIGKDVDEEYYKNVLSIQLNPEVKKDIKIVFSPEHGTANIPVQEVYKRAGYTCIPVVEQCSPDPDFSNTPTPNPEQAGAYELSLKYAKENQADLILVCDPDADRMGVGVLHNGEYVVLTGNQSGSVEIEYICSQLQKQGKMPENPVMFNTVVTSDLGEKVASDYGVSTEKTLTGFKFIGEKVAKYEKTHEKNYVFGYEESYGSLIKPFVRDKDAPQACLMLAEACAFYKEQGKDLVDVLDSLYDRHGTYEESQVALSLAGEAGAKRIKEILATLRKDAPTEIGGTKVVRSEDYKECTIKEGDTVTELTGFTKSDVLKYYLEDGSWVAVRPSGTEPKCKFYYCIKGSSKEDAHNKTVHFQKAMDDLIAE